MDFDIYWQDWEVEKECRRWKHNKFFHGIGPGAQVSHQQYTWTNLNQRHNAMVGISVEPLVVIEGLTPAAQVIVILLRAGHLHFQISSPMEISIFILADGSLQCVFIYGVQSENAWESLQLLLQVITDHFFVSRNFTQMSARWHWSKITILALRWFPPTLTRDPRNNLCLCPFSNSGEWTLFVFDNAVFWQVFLFYLFWWPCFFGRYSNFERRLQQNPYFWRKWSWAVLSALSLMSDDWKQDNESLKIGGRGWRSFSRSNFFCIKFLITDIVFNSHSLGTWTCKLMEHAVLRHFLAIVLER